jgi:hypothetical protein
VRFLWLLIRESRNNSVVLVLMPRVLNPTASIIGLEISVPLEIEILLFEILFGS